MNVLSRLVCVALVVVVIGSATGHASYAQQKDRASAQSVPVAVFAFHERSVGRNGLGEQVADLVLAELAQHEQITLADRREIEAVLNEMELGLAGFVDRRAAVQVGHLVGAKLLVVGSVLEIDTNRVLIGQIIGTETSRVLGVRVKGSTVDDLVELSEQLARQIAETIVERGEQLVAPQPAKGDRVAKLRKQLQGESRPTVRIQIREMHIGGAAPDPAAQTELEFLCTELGFPVVTSAEAPADILLQGEGVSEFATRRGNLVTVKARLELKAVDLKGGKLITADRYSTIGVDLAERLAAKDALQAAAAELGTRVLPKIAK